MSDVDVAGSTSAATPERNAVPRPPPSRRREKPQLSCNACRKRKVRCDRLHPCSNCSSRGQSSSCVYPTAQVSLSSRPRGSAQGQDRIDQLERLVLSLMQQTATTSTNSPSDCSSATPAQARSGSEPQQPVAIKSEAQRDVPPSPSDYGSIRIGDSGVSYVSNAHWAAVLDGIAGLRDLFEQDDEGRSPGFDQIQPLQINNFPRPQLLYGCPLPGNPASIVESMPPRSVVDRLVSRYFNVLDMVPGMVHSGKFLREYEEFWKSPQTAPIIWVGLLYGMMCLSTQYQQAYLTSPESIPTSEGSTWSSQASGNTLAVNDLREKVIQCLLLGHYTKGGPFVLETLILYFLSEVFLLREIEVGIWILVGNLVQIAIHMGYHRDAKHFPKISPFEGEMRRRVWAMILQLNASISTQMGLPGLIKESQIDTAEPRNLNDADFDEHTTELPPSRPETEVTPILYVLAKIRLIRAGVKVADMVTGPRPYSYAKVLELDEQVSEARDALPSSMKWTGLSSALTVSSQLIIQRIFIEVGLLRLKLILHRKFLVSSSRGLQQQYVYSRSACLNAAMKILEFQHLIDEEVQLDGRLYQNRWRLSPAFTHDFLVATSTLCFYLQSYNKRQEVRRERDSLEESSTVEKIRQLLRTSQLIWLRSSAASKEARTAAAALGIVLGDAGIEFEAVKPVDPTPEVVIPNASPVFPYFSGLSDLMMPGYDFSGSEFNLMDGGSAWQRFSTGSDIDVEQWTGGGDLQQMNLSP